MTSERSSIEALVICQHAEHREHLIGLLEDAGVAIVDRGTADPVDLLLVDCALWAEVSATPKRPRCVVALGDDYPGCFAAGVDDVVPWTEVGDRLASILARARWRAALSLEERFRSVEQEGGLLFTLFDINLFITDAEAKRGHLYISPSGEALVGISRERLYADAHVFLEVLHADDRQLLGDATRDASKPSHAVYRIRRDGEIRYLESRTFPIPASRTEAAKVIGIVRDVTDRRRAEIEREAHADRMQALHQIAANPKRSWAEQIESAIELTMRFFQMETGSVVRVHDDASHEATVHWSVPSDSSIAVGARVPMDRDRWNLVRDKPDVVVLADIAGAEGVAESRAHEQLSVRSIIAAPLFVHGTAWGVFHVASSRPLTEELGAGDRQFFALVAQWVTLLIERVIEDAERDERARRDRETQKLESLGLLAGGVAHDFNNLLMGVMGNATLLSGEAHLSPPARESLDHIVVASERAAELTRQMLAFAGRGHVRVASVMLADVLEQTRVDVESLVAGGAEIVFETEDTDVHAELDAELVRRALRNLIQNALDATAEGRGRVVVRLGVEDFGERGPRGAYVSPDAPGGQYAFVEVEDSGRGIAFEMTQRIFDPFFTTGFAGRGLGLAAVLGIVRTHRGAIEVDSDVGRGTRVRLLFPVSADPGSNAVSTGPAITIGDRAQTRSSRRR